MKNSLFKRAFAAVAAVPLALTQCLTYSSYAVANDSAQPSAEDTGDSTTTKEAYTLKGNLLYIAPDQVESTWYSDFYAELIEMGSKKSTGSIPTERVVNAILSRSDKFGNYDEWAMDIVNLINDDVKYSISTSGDITVTGSLANFDATALAKDAQDIINKKFDELKAEYESAKKEVSEKFNIPEEEFETLRISKEELAAKYGISVEDLDKYNITVEDIAAKLDVPVTNFDDVETIDDIKVPVFDFSDIDFSGTYEFVIEGSDLANGNTVDVKAKYTANQALNGKTVFAIGDCADFALSKIEEIKNSAYATIDDIAVYSPEAAEEVRAEVDKKFDAYAKKVNKAKNQFSKVETVNRNVQAANMAELIEKINNFADNNKYVDKVEDKTGTSYRLPSSVAEIFNKSIVAQIYDEALTQVNNALVNYDVQIQSSEIAAFADSELYNLTAKASEGTYTLTGDFPDEEVADSVKHLVASVDVGDIYSTDTTLVTIGLRIYREPVVTTTTTTLDTTTTTTTTADTTTTSNDGSTSTTTTDSTSTSVDSSTSTSTTTNTNGGMVLPGEVKSFSVAATADGEGFYYSYEKEFHKEQVSGLTLNVIYADDTTGEVDLIDNFDFEATPAEKFSTNNATFKYNVALVYSGDDIVDETGRVVLANGDTLKDSSDYDVSVVAYIGVRGDINLDNRADAVDATQAQMYYAVISAGNGTTENTKLSISNETLVTSPTSIYDQFAAFLGDVNQSTHVVEDNWKATKDKRQIDAVDATNISTYYAKVSNPDNTDDDETIWNNILEGNI